MAVVRCEGCNAMVDLDWDDTFDCDTNLCECCQADAEAEREISVVSYHHTDQAMYDAGHKPGDFA